MCDWYEVRGHRFGVRSTSQAFASWIRYALRAYVTEPTRDEEAGWPAFSVVVDDGADGRGRVGRAYNILYVGTTDVARTLDVSFLARCLLREIDGMACHARNDVLFLRAGLIEIEGRVGLVPSLLVPVLCAARRRAEKHGINAPGGRVTALDPQGGDLIAPPTSLEGAPDAIGQLSRSFPASVNGTRDRSPIEDGERRRVGAMIGLNADQEHLVDGKPRSETTLELAMAAMNLEVLGGAGLRTIAAAVGGAKSISLKWSSTDEMLEALVLACTA